VSLRIERSDATVVLTIDRPHTRNALDADLARRLAEAATEAANDPSARAIVLTASGDEAFVSGGDLNEIAKHVREGGGPHPVLDMYVPLLVLETGDLPVIAAVQGDVYGGGCELILLCDQVMMESHTGLAFRHARMGLSPAWGGITRLIERVGPVEASRLLFTAEKIDATEALRIGLVGEVVPKGQVLTKALERAALMAKNSRAVIAAQKRAIMAVRRAFRGTSIDLERAVFAELWGGPAHLAAIDGFFRRRSG
jgi:enoyl-CoA hydratase/carnithine racemase